MMFCTEDFECVVRKKLQAVKKTGPDVSHFTASYNKALNWCSNVTPEEAQFFLKSTSGKRSPSKCAMQIVQCLCSFKLLPSVQVWSLCKGCIVFWIQLRFW